MIWSRWNIISTLFWANFQIFFAYRGQLVIRALQSLLMPTVLVLAWLNVERRADCVFSDGDYLLYYLMMPLIFSLTACNTVFEIPQEIRDGTLNRDLLKPFPPIWFHIVRNLAGKAVQILFLGGVISGFFLIFHGNIVFPSFSWARAVLFFCSLVLAMNLRFVITTTIAMTGFWIERVETLHLVLNQAVYALFGGMVVPIETYPPIFRNIAYFLPYRYALSFPIEVLRGKISERQIFLGVLIACSYCLIFFIICRILWRSGLRQYTAYGG